jgi:hypothetical protein
LAISKRHRRRVEIACGNCYGNLHWSLEKKKTKLNIMQK